MGQAFAPDSRPQTKETPDEIRSCGNQPANIRLINRRERNRGRPLPSPPSGEKKETEKKTTRLQQLDRAHHIRNLVIFAESKRGRCRASGAYFRTRARSTPDRAAIGEKRRVSSSM